MRIETHFHCRYGSGCAIDTPRAMLFAAARQGIDAVCMTDHNSLASWDSLGPGDVPAGLVVVPGVECTVSDTTGSDGDILVVADSPEVLRALDTGGWPVPSVGYLAEALAPFPRSRWFASWAHPMGHDTPCGLDEEALAILRFVDAVEGFNGNHRDMAALSPHIFVVADQMGLRRTAGSDAHAVRDVGRAVTVAEGTASDAAGVVALLRAAARFRHETRPAPWEDPDWSPNPRIRFE